jgi:hypothetical protein
MQERLNSSYWDQHRLEARPKLRCDQHGGAAYPAPNLDLSGRYPGNTRLLSGTVTGQRIRHLNQ